MNEEKQNGEGLNGGLKYTFDGGGRNQGRRISGRNDSSFREKMEKG